MPVGFAWLRRFGERATGDGAASLGDSKTLRWLTNQP